VRDPGFVHRTQDYALLPGVIPGLQRLQREGFALAIVTNQSGIGRGYFDEPQFHAFQAKLLAELGASGVPIEASYFCPHLPEHGCSCRKPAPGMLQRAVTELGADLAQSWVIGDSDADAQLAQRAGCRFVRIVAPSEADRSQHRVADLRCAAQLIASARR